LVDQEEVDKYENESAAKKGKEISGFRVKKSRNVEKEECHVDYVLEKENQDDGELPEAISL
jgi:hypothetical protein